MMPAIAVERDHDVFLKLRSTIPWDFISSFTTYSYEYYRFGY